MKAMLNILDDSEQDKQNMRNTERAMVNLLEDSIDEKEKLENTEKAVVNILEDYAVEKAHIIRVNKELEAVQKDLEIQVEEIRRSNKELEAFSYSVSHDLRAPLRAINGFSEVLMEDYYQNLDEEGKKVIKTIMRNANKMSNLIDDILEYSRIGRRAVTKQKLDMKLMFEATFKELMAIEDSNREVHFTVGDLDPAIGDTVMIKQLLTNLVSNALKYTRTKDKSIISVRGMQTDKGYTYAVQDNGVGFDMRYYDKLFGVFQRLHKERDFEGTGVGLAIAHRLTLQHGGTIWAESVMDEGSTFYFTLAPPPAPAKKHTETA